VSERCSQFAHIRDLYKERGEASEEQRADWDCSLFYIAQVHISAIIRGKGRSRYPDTSMWLTDDARLYFAERLKASANPIHKARYVDFLWEKSPPGRERAAYGREAVAAYWDCTRLYLTSPRPAPSIPEQQPWRQDRFYSDAVDALGRAWMIAVGLRDRQLIDQGKVQIFDALAMFEKNEAYRWCIDLIEVLMHAPAAVTDGEWDRTRDIVDRTLEWFARQRQERPEHLMLYFQFETAYLGLKARLLQTRKAPEDDWRESRRALARRFEQEAATAIELSKSYSVAASFLRNAQDVYSSIGDKAEVNRLKLLIKETHAAARESGAFQEIEVTGSLPVTEIDRHMDELLSKHPPLTVLSGIASIWMPSQSAVRSELQDLAQESPLSLIIGREILRNDNREEAARTRPEVFEAQVTSHTMLQIQFAALCLLRVITRLRAEHKIAARRVARHIAKSPWVEERNAALIRHGLNRYYAGDYISAVHILTPQLEDVIRHILPTLGLAMTSTRNGKEREKPLDVIFDDSGEHEALRRLLGDDLWCALRTVLIEKWGWNLRNQVGHGLVSEDECDALHATVLVMLYLIIADLTPAPSAETESVEANHDGAVDVND